MLIDKNVVKKNKEDELCETKIGRVIGGKTFLEITLQRMLKNLVVH